MGLDTGYAIGQTGRDGNHDESIDRALKYVLSVSVLCLPLLSGSVLYLASIGLLGTSSVGRTQLVSEFIWSKASVDFALGCIGLLYVGYVTSRGRLSIVKEPALLVFLAAILLSILVSLVVRPGYAVAGIRFFYPVLMVFVGLELFSERDVRTLGRVVVVLAVLATLLGVVQLVVSDGLSSGRIGGLYGVYSVFSFPSTFAAVLGVAIAFVQSDTEWSRPCRFGLFLLLFAGILLSQSGTGIAILGTVVAVWLYRNVSLLLVVPVGVLGAATLPLLTRRANIWQSLLARLGIFRETIGSATALGILFGQGAGIGTDTSVVLVRMGYLSGPSIIADSLYNALLLQVGVVGLFAYVLFNVTLLSGTLRRNSYLSTVVSYLIPVFLVASITQNTFEIFPLNVVYWTSCGAFLGAMAGWRSVEN